jgi:hypothetical protein
MSTKTIADIKAEEFSRKYLYKNPNYERFEADIVASLVKYYVKNPDGVPTIKVTEVGWMCMVDVI